MDMKKRFGLAARFNLLAISLILATAAGITSYLIWEEAKYSREEIDNFGRTTASMMAQNGEFGVFTRDREALQAILEGIETNPDLGYAAFLDDGKRLLRSYSKPRFDTIPGPPSGMDQAAGGNISRRRFRNSRDGVEFTDYLVPVIIQPGKEFAGITDAAKHRPRVIGYLQLGLSMENRDRKLRQFILSAAMVTSVLVLAGTLATLLITRRITSPIRKLVDFTHAVSEEKMGEQAPVGGSAEIADLSHSFNLMLTRLKSYRDQLEVRNMALAEANRQEADVRRRAEEDRELLNMAVEQAAETIVITDIGGKVQYVNPAFEQTTGYKAAEVIGRNLRMLKSGRHDSDYYRDMWDTLASGQVWSGHFINRRKDGTMFEEMAVISPVRDASGNIVNYVAVKRDVTREVQLEEQLRQSQKMEAVGKLAGGIAHDFNNLLTAILGYSDLLLGSLDRHNPMRMEVEEIKKAGERAAVLTRQILAFSRKQMLQPRMLDMNRVISNMDIMLRRMIRESIELIARPEPEIWKVRVDPGQIEQVLMNLAVNARDAMPHGGKLIIETMNVEFDENFIRDHPYVLPGPYVMMAVTDTGCGMERDTISRIFEPFFTTKPQGKGTGLGLSTVYGIVKQSKGYILVDSEVGKGSTFRVYLPRAEGEAERAGAVTEEASVKWMGTETILLAEDEDLVRDFVLNVLRSRGYTVLDARDGAGALETGRLHDGPIHLLLTDVVMPQMGGHELSMRLGPSHPGMRVLYMSGYTEAILRQGELEAGVPFLQKPFRPEALLGKVREVLDAPSRPLEGCPGV